GIDPWRLDLFDPNPVVLLRDGKIFYFRRLTEVFLAYKDSADRIFAGLHDGSQEIVFEAPQFKATVRKVTLLWVVPSKRSFPELFLEYLKTLEQFPESEGLGSVQSGEPRVFKPKKVHAVQIQGNTIVFHKGATAESNEDNLDQFAFVGEMF